jgi:hypothetical protein
MISPTHFEVFKLLVQRLFRRAAAGMWLDLFEGLLQRESQAPGKSAREAATSAKTVDVSGEELRQLFEWLTAVAFYNNKGPIEVISTDAMDAATAIRKDITHGCIRMINEPNQGGDFPTDSRELLMKLWDDWQGNLVSRTIRDVGEKKLSE